MAEKVIKGSVGIPVTDFKDNVDFSNISYVAIDFNPSATSANMQVFYEGNGGYVKGYKSGPGYYESYKRFDIGTQSGTGLRSVPDGGTMYIFAAYSSTLSGTYADVRVWKRAGQSWSEIADSFNRGNWTIDDVLYQDTLENFENADIVEVQYDWDETPTTDVDDPNNMNPQGGENADRGSFSETDVMNLVDIPNPEITMNMSYGKFIGVYVLNESEMNLLGDRIFSTNIWDQILNRLTGVAGFNDCILSAVQLPVSIANTSQATFRVGGVEVTGADVRKTTSRYSNPPINMGSITLKEIWGSARDYTDTSVEIFLPYVGVKEIDTDIAVNSTLTLMCTIDYWTGDILYLLHASNASAKSKYFTAESVPYRWQGNCGKQVQLGRVDNSTQILGLIGAIGSFAVAGVGAAHALGVAGASKAALASSEMGINMMKAGTKAGILSGIIPSLTTGFKPITQSSGGIAGSTGSMDYQKAYLLVKRAVPEYPSGWREQIGAPRNQRFAIDDLRGYTLFNEVRLDNMGIAVEEEIQELKRALTTEGVVL